MEAAIEALKAAIAAAGPSARDNILHSLNQLVVSIEEPIDALNKLAGVQMPAAAAKIAAESGLYQALAASKEPLSAEQLARKISAAPGFTTHLLQYLVCLGHVKEVDQDLFAPNAKTEAFAQSTWIGGIQHYFENTAPVIQAFPAFMKKHKYQDVTDSRNTPFQTAHKTDLTAFEWLPTMPQNVQWFSEYMQIQRYGTPDWLTVFPIEKELGDWKLQDSSDGALFVDVGGAFGHQAIAFHQKYSHLPGRVIVQDQAPVIQNIQLPSPLEKIAINFFESQPIKGAKFYYLRNVLHDHPDARCLVILKHLAAAMGPGSAILIDEMCFPAKGAPQLATQFDMLMLSCLAAIERTLSQWQALIDAAGLKIKASYQYTTLLADTVHVVVPK